MTATSSLRRRSLITSWKSDVARKAMPTRSRYSAAPDATATSAARGRPSQARPTGTVTSGGSTIAIHGSARQLAVSIANSTRVGIGSSISRARFRGWRAAGKRSGLRTAVAKSTASVNRRANGAHAMKSPLAIERPAKRPTTASASALGTSSSPRRIGASSSVARDRRSIVSRRPPRSSAFIRTRHRSHANARK